MCKIEVVILFLILVLDMNITVFGFETESSKFLSFFQQVVLASISL